WQAFRLVAGGTQGIAYEGPFPFYDFQNNLHLALGRTTYLRDSQGRLIRDDNAILRSVNLGAFSVVAEGSALGPNYPSLYPFVSAGPPGGVHVAWTHFLSPSTIVRYQPPSGGPIDISGPLRGGFGFAMDDVGNAISHSSTAPV